MAYKKIVLNLKKCHFYCVPNTAPFFYIFIMEKGHKSQKNGIFLACQTGPYFFHSCPLFLIVATLEDRYGIPR